MFRKKFEPPSTQPDVEADEIPVAISQGILDSYVRSAPSRQNALDLFDGSWLSSLPPVWNLHAGTLPTFDDKRIKALLRYLDSIKSFKVLELGPLEGGHTYMLHEAGARVVSVESNVKRFLKCLVVKEILSLNRAHLLLGDFVPFLEATSEKFDLVLASGVLHHASDPVGLIELTTRVTDKLAIWTHYWDGDAIAKRPDVDQYFSDPAVTADWRGGQVRLHPHCDRRAAEWTGFSGGPDTSAPWMERDDLMAVLSGAGYSKITVLDEEPDHVNGPAILLCAER